MTKQIPLTQGKFTLVDDDLFNYLNQWKWCAAKDKRNWYARRVDTTNGRKNIHMSRVILGVNDPEIFVDHINQNGLDNRRSNLRECTNQENQRNKRLQKNNKSGYRGVSWRMADNKYVVQIYVNKKGMTIGYFSNIIEAARAYDAKALELFGEFARLNFPKGTQS